jgi:small-conductance mechanosensitive channel
MLTLASAFLISIFILLLLRYVPLHKKEVDLSRRQIRHLLKFYRPLQFLMLATLLLYIAYGGLLALPYFFTAHVKTLLSYQIATSITGFLLLFILYQLSVTATNVMRASLVTVPSRSARKLAVFMPVFAKIIKATVITILLGKAIYAFYVPTNWMPDAQTVSRLLVILVAAWILLQVIDALEVVFSLQYNPEREEDLDSRRTYTHIVILKRVALVILAILTIVAVLMTFEKVRGLGATFLVSTGVLATIIGVSGKQPLEGFFRGLQLAITQPIRINDTIQIEGEVGVVSVMNLNHVIVTLWDKRQMIVPTGYFLDKPFENWTHESNELLGTIFLYVDYEASIDRIREHFLEYLRGNTSGLWNEQVGLLQVTDVKDQTIELRMLVSADNAEKLFDLCCDIREQMLYFIRSHCIQGIPKRRVDYRFVRTKKHLDCDATSTITVKTGFESGLMK